MRNVRKSYNKEFRFKLMFLFKIITTLTINRCDKIEKELKIN